MIDWSGAGVPGGTAQYRPGGANARPQGVNVLNYGAVSGGVVNCTTAFANAQAACPSGSYVYVPDGTYLISGTITPKIERHLAWAEHDRNRHPALGRRRVRDAVAVALCLGTDRAHGHRGGHGGQPRPDREQPDRHAGQHRQGRANGPADRSHPVLYARQYRERLGRGGMDRLRPNAPGHGHVHGRQRQLRGPDGHPRPRPAHRYDGQPAVDPLDDGPHRGRRVRDVDVRLHPAAPLTGRSRWSM
ncbi:MAG: glycoside hydrolase family 55 protein [Anaerotruncus sp.]|nr:glycoside hydrolase family 55 protein [Anaerotruncus sp.]